MQIRKQQQLVAWSVLVWLIVMSGTTWGATRTWQGYISTNWLDSNNWSGTTVPVAGDTVVVSSSASNVCVLSGSTQSLVSVTIGTTNDPTTYGKLIVQAGGVITNPTVTIGGGINFYGSLEVQSNASFCSGSNYISLTGNGMINVLGGTLVGPVAGGEYVCRWDPGGWVWESPEHGNSERSLRRLCERLSGIRRRQWHRSYEYQ